MAKYKSYNMIRTGLILMCILYNFGAYSQSKKANTTKLDQPKLVVGIVVDQMRYDFLYRYYDRLSENGFKRLINGGVNCINNHYNYTPTNTGPGHATIYAGSPPAINGIAGNDWYERSLGKNIYCTQDSSVSGVGSTGEAGEMSPRNLKVTSIADQVKLASGNKSKIIGIALKDRGAILPAGHSADAAYWHDNGTGNFSSSTYYMEKLPQWVEDFNKLNYSEKYLNTTWETLYPINSYTQSDIDNQPFENTLKGEDKPIFPHKYIAGKKYKYDNIRTSPFGNTMTADFAVAAIKGEQLGKHSATDFLAVSFSSTDYIGHSFGPNSIESEDAYLRLDKDFEKLLNTLDAEVGKDNYLLFLTADHGICDVPGHSHYYKLPGKVLDKSIFYKKINDHLNAALGEGKYLIEYEDYQYFVNFDLLKEKKIEYKDFFEVFKAGMMSNEGIAQIIDLHNIGDAMFPNFFLNKIKNGINPKRSGDILVIQEPGWISSYTTGTSHGSLYEYDTHVPLIFYGWGLKPAEIVAPVEITDIAPTVAALLHILAPTGNIGNPIEGVVRQK